ncbi:hypothetical protein PsAD5_00116 [Pseudovibrio sp. Ad5]|uniref:hypothetical protein n=1 Tax=Pseudovibrio sp. Ad5 TaxID=989436 RepID=UPI0007AED2A1|nr:hypothetical protein [Pseudovibrio sp. Ad5]KZL02167.1 hypothetical protein PsAD5_00116 [Pseudovibrio sp. Ad5]
MQQPNLQDLADMPGAGVAQTELMRLGFWDELRGGDARKWQVSVTGYVEETRTYEVSAHSAEEAMEKAEEAATKDFDDEDSIEAEDAELIQEAQ